MEIRFTNLRMMREKMHGKVYYYRFQEFEGLYRGEWVVLGSIRYSPYGILDVYLDNRLRGGAAKFHVKHRLGEANDFATARDLVRKEFAEIGNHNLFA